MATNPKRPKPPDDFIILTKTRWQLRHAIKLLNQLFTAFGFIQHPDKTFIGRIAKGFDWMGAWITDCGVIRIAPRAIQNHLDRLLQLYEHVRKQPTNQQVMRVEQYRLRWQRWAKCVICYSEMAGSNIAIPHHIGFVERPLCTSSRGCACCIETPAIAQSPSTPAPLPRTMGRVIRGLCPTQLGSRNSRHCRRAAVSSTT